MLAVEVIIQKFVVLEKKKLTIKGAYFLRCFYK